MTALANKTVIFVTHQVEFLPAADLILVWNCFHILLLMFVHLYITSHLNKEVAFFLIFFLPFGIINLFCFFFPIKKLILLLCSLVLQLHVDIAFKSHFNKLYSTFFMIF